MDIMEDPIYDAEKRENLREKYSVRRQLTNRDKRLQNLANERGDVYVKFGGTVAPVDYRAAAVLALAVIAAIAMGVTASVGGPWWAYVVVVAIAMALIWLTVAFL